MAQYGDHKKSLPMQVNALEMIASHRRAGILRSEMAKAVNMDAKSFHYIATVRIIRN